MRRSLTQDDLSDSPTTAKTPSQSNDTKEIAKPALPAKFFGIDEVVIPVNPSFVDQSVSASKKVTSANRNEMEDNPNDVDSAGHNYCNIKYLWLFDNNIMITF